jgi:hypothetical protein
MVYSSVKAMPRMGIIHGNQARYCVSVPVLMACISGFSGIDIWFQIFFNLVRLTNEHSGVGLLYELDHYDWQTGLCSYLLESILHLQHHHQHVGLVYS